jgi:hypothetical protein
VRKISLLLGLLVVAVLAVVLVVIVRPFTSAVSLGGPLGPPGNLSTVSARDTTTGIVVWYHDRSKRYELRTSVHVIVSVPPARCSVDGRPS